MLKVVYCVGALLSILAALGLILLGVDYMTLGYGLHPLAAFAGVVLVLMAGYTLCKLVDTMED